MSIDKKTLRAECLAAREKLNVDFTAHAATQIVSRVLETVPATAKYVAGYLSHRNEINPLLAMEALAARGQKLCLPVIVREKAPLAFRRWKPGVPLEKGMYGIDVPAASASPIIPDVVLVPLVAFDAKGHRLGYGLGYYDQTIRRLREAGKAQIIGVSYSTQQIKQIPHEAHDEILDAVVTEKQVIRFT